MKATTFVSRSSAYASCMLASRGEPFRGMLKREDRRRARHSLNADLASVSLSEVRQDFSELAAPAPTTRAARYEQAPRFHPSFLLSELPAPTRYAEVTVTRKSSSRSRPLVETLRIAV